MKFDHEGIKAGASMLQESAGHLKDATRILESVTWDGDVFGKFAESVAFHKSVVENEQKIIEEMNLVASRLHESAETIQQDAQKVIDLDQSFGKFTPAIA